MGRPIKIILPDFRPHTCKECPLCGLIPKGELEEGTKWTHICVADDRRLSGRGTKQPNARNRCSQKQYELMYFRKQGKFPISEAKMARYQIQQTKLVFRE